MTEIGSARDSCFDLAPALSLPRPLAAATQARRVLTQPTPDGGWAVDRQGPESDER
jgi:hypothetical protein